MQLHYIREYPVLVTALPLVELNLEEIIYKRVDKD